MHGDSDPAGPQTLTIDMAPCIDPDPNVDIELPDFELQVDEAYCGVAADTVAPEDEATLIETLRSIRRTAIPGGMVRRHVGSVALHYRLSADAALRCQNVVRSKPRMRKRKMTRTDSIASSSIVTGSMSSSPVNPPSLPSPHIGTLPDEPIH